MSSRLTRSLAEFNPFTLLAAGAALGSAGTLFARNFIPNEKKISHPIELPYGVGDPQFERSLGQLLGPPLVDGNKVTALQNGDEIFPAMLAAIAGRAALGHAGILHLLGGPRRGTVFPCPRPAAPGPG